MEDDAKSQSMTVESVIQRVGLEKEATVQLGLALVV